MATKVFIKSFLLAVFWLSQSQVLAAESMSGTIFDFSFNEQYKKSNVIGWDPQRHSSAEYGGRSWQEKDILRFNHWLNHLLSATNAEQENTRLSILNRWGIAHDCFDTIIALHFIYSLENGLAAKYGSFNSIQYAKDPKAMIFKTLKNFGTINASDITYEVDLWNTNNYSSGLIYVYGGSPGHSYFLGNFTRDFIARKLEGPFPAGFSRIKSSFFFQTHRDKAIKKANFRRFPLFEKKGRGIISTIPSTLPRGTNNARWWQCVNEYSQTTGSTRPLWENIKNFLTYRQQNRSHHINCAHNQQTGISYYSSLRKAVAAFCIELKERIKRVNKGYEQCFAVEASASACAADASSDYSTNQFDGRLHQLILQMEDTVQRYPMSTKNTQRLANLQCAALDLHAGSGLEPLPINFQLLQAEKGQLRFAKWIKQATDPALNISHDPNQALPIRWGCHTYESYECIRGARVSKAMLMQDAREKNSLFYTFFTDEQNRKILNIKASINNPTVKNIVFYFLDTNTYRHMPITRPGNSTKKIDITGLGGKTVIYYMDENGTPIQEEFSII